MSYYILPKNFNAIPINLLLTDEKIQIYASHSTYNYYNSSLKQLICDCVAVNSEITFENISKIINVYENISTFSKCKENSILFYELLEIINVLYLFDGFHSLNMNLFIMSSDNRPIVNCISFFRKGYIDTFISTSQYDFIFYELNYKDYVFEFILCLIKILKCQKVGGMSIIKIHNLFYKPIIDIIYILSSIYEKVYIIKPNTNDITTFDKYIVCKNFIIDDVKKDIYKKYYFELAKFINAYLQNNNNNNNNINSNSNILSILNHEIPTYFINKINDVNIIIGQQQLEATDQIINIFKNKSKNDKIESIKNNNIQKAIMWCEKNKIPYNNISEKVNIFLPLKKEIV